VDATALRSYRVDADTPEAMMPLRYFG